MSTRATPNRLTHVQFFKLTEELRNRQEVYTTQRPDLVEAAKIATERLGFLVTRHQVQDAKNATGVTWEPKKTTRNPNFPVTVSQSVHKLAQAVHKLYKDFGTTAPQELVDVLNMPVKTGKR